MALYIGVAPSDVISRFTNKTIMFRFTGRELSFSLFHALFSCFEIEEGLRLLAGTAVPETDAAGTLARGIFQSSSFP